MNNRELITSRYSPGNLAPEVLEKLFVARSGLLDEIANKVYSSVTSRRKHYILLVGPRGVGKTHLLALLYHRLNTALRFAENSQHFVVAYLNEEEWGIASFLDFLLVVLRSLGTTEPKLDERIKRIYDTFEKSNELALDAAEELLIAIVQGRTLVLLCENLGDLFEGLGAEGQARWRAMVQQHPFWCIVSTTPSLFFGITKQTEPFYGFFTVRTLDRLSLESALELLRKKAELERNDDLARFIDTPTGRARVRAIHHIAGGNHRAYIVLSDFLTRESLDQLVTPFMQMVDDLTPYYQERMRHLTSPLQRKLVDYLCKQRRPIPVRDIAKGTLVQQQSAAKQLGELAKAGVVQRTPSGRESYYELAEPLMRICIEVKDNRTTYIRTFVELLRHWFSFRELEARSRAPVNGLLGEVDHVHARAALAEYRESRIDLFLEALRIEADRCDEQGDLAGLVEAAGRRADELGKRRDFRQAIDAAFKLGDFESVVSRGLVALNKYPTDKDIRLSYARALMKLDRPTESLEQFDRLISLDPTSVRAWCLRGEPLFALKRYEEVLCNEDRVLKIDPEHPHSFLVKAGALYRLGRKDEAFALLRARASVDNRPETQMGLAELLLENGDNEEGLAVCEAVLERTPDSDYALCRRGIFLLRLGRYADALANEERLLSIDPTHWHSYHHKIEALQKLGRGADALTVARDLAKRNPNDADSWSFVADTMMDNGLLEEADEALSRAATHSTDESTEDHRFLRARLNFLRGDLTSSLDLTRHLPVSFRRRNRALLAIMLAALDNGDRDIAASASQQIARDEEREDALLELLRRLQLRRESELWKNVSATVAERFPKRYSIWYQHTLALATARDYGAAEEALARLVSINPAIRTRLTSLISAVARDGLAHVANEAVRRIENSESIDEDGAVLADLLRLEAALGRPSSLVASLAPFFKASATNVDATLAAALLELSRDVASGNLVDVAEWSRALGQLGGPPARERARMAYTIFSAAASFAETKDEKALLELPLEQRALLESEFSRKSNGGERLFAL